MKSMTGFGSADGEARRGTLHVEMRSYNHRFLDLRLRLHRDLLPLESRIHGWARRRLERGRVEIRVEREEGEADAAALRFRPEAMAFYLDAARRLREAYGVPGELDVCTALRLRDVVSSVDERDDPEETWSEVSPVLERALGTLEAMQEREGGELQADLLQRVEALGAELGAVERTAQTLPALYRERLREKIAQLMDPDRYDPQRFAQEIVLYVDKIDVTEEIVRLKSHLALVKASLEAGSLPGKRLDFLAQEILREVNTIGSKNTHPEIVYAVVAMKTELEKIREQAQNLL